MDAEERNSVVQERYCTIDFYSLVQCNKWSRNIGRKKSLVNRKCLIELDKVQEL